MNDPATSPLIDLSVDIEASPNTVWEILTTPALFSAWFNATVEFEPRAGSAFRADCPGMQSILAGEVVALDPESRRLTLTWGVEEGPQADIFPAGCSLVEFQVHDAPDGCRVQVRHSQLPSAALARDNEEGWRFQLSRMALVANRSELETALGRTLAGWFSAWNEPDEAKRLESLGRCCAEEITFRDDWAVASGIDQLNRHIAMSMMFMPGWRLESTNDVRVCRGEALVGWRSIGPDGTVIEGFNHVRADRDGALHRVTGFPGGG